MIKKTLKYKIGIFTIIGTIFGGLLGYLSMIYYILFISPHLNIPYKFNPIESFLLFAFIILMIYLFNYIGHCLDDERAVKEFRKFIISIGSFIVGTIIYSIILLIIILYDCFGFINYYLYIKNSNVFVWTIGMIVILICFIIIRKFLVKDNVSN